MDLEKVIKILGDILAGRLFESDLAAKATFPTLFSTGQLGNNTALIVKCVEEDFESECGQRDITIPDAPIPNSTSLESAPTVGQHRIDGKSGRIRKPTGSATKPIGVTHEFGEGKEASPNEVLGKGNSTSSLIIVLGVSKLIAIYPCRYREGKERSKA